MKEATITISDELAEALEAYRHDQGDKASIPAITEAALKSYLQQLGYVPAAHPLHITSAPVGSGKTDVSIAHDRELASE
jgi:hypothetical protein